MTTSSILSPSLSGGARCLLPTTPKSHRYARTGNLLLFPLFRPLLRFKNARTRTRTRTRTCRLRPAGPIASIEPLLLTNFDFATPSLYLFTSLLSVAVGSATYGLLQATPFDSESDSAAGEAAGKEEGPGLSQGRNWVVRWSQSKFYDFVYSRCPAVSGKLVQVEQERQEGRDGRDVGFRRVCLPAGDGGTVSLDWPAHLDLEKADELDSVLLVVAGGVEGSGEFGVRSLVGRALQCGFFPAVLNLRGCGGSPVTSPRLFSAADSDDVQLAARFLQRARPDATILGVGVGLGGNVLAKFLGECADQVLVKAGVCVGNPFEVGQAEEEEDGFREGLITVLEANQMLFAGRQDGFDLAGGLAATSMREFDAAISRVSHGFESVEGFYGHASSGRSLWSVRTPLLCIHADYPSAPLFAVPGQAFEKNPYLSLVMSSAQGRVCDDFLSLQEFVLQWLAAVELALLKGRHPLDDAANGAVSGVAQGSGNRKQLQVAAAQEGGANVNRDTGSHEELAEQPRIAGDVEDRGGWSTVVAEDGGQQVSSLGTELDVDDKLIELDVDDKLIDMPHTSYKVHKLDDDDDDDDDDDEAAPEVAGSVYAPSPVANGALAVAAQPDTGQACVPLIDGGQNEASKGGTQVEEKAEGEGEADGERGQVEQAAESIMKVLDVTMPGTLSEEKKKKVIAAVGRGETVVTALQEAVPEDVREKMFNAVSGAVQARGISSQLVGFGKNFPPPTIPDDVLKRIKEKLSAYSPRPENSSSAQSENAGQSALPQPSESSNDNPSPEGGLEKRGDIGGGAEGKGNVAGIGEAHSDTVSETNVSAQQGMQMKENVGDKQEGTAETSDAHRQGRVDEKVRDIKSDKHDGSPQTDGQADGSSQQNKTPDPDSGTQDTRPQGATQNNQGDGSTPVQADKQDRSTDRAKDVAGDGSLDKGQADAGPNQEGARDDSAVNNGQGEEALKLGKEVGSDAGTKDAAGQVATQVGQADSSGQKGDVAAYKDDGSGEATSSSGDSQSGPTDQDVVKQDKKLGIDTGSRDTADHVDQVIATASDGKTGATDVTDSAGQPPDGSQKDDQNQISASPAAQTFTPSPAQVPPAVDFNSVLQMFTGFDDSTQMAVTNVFGVVESMLDKLEAEGNGDQKQQPEVPGTPDLNEGRHVGIIKSADEGSTGGGKGRTENGPVRNLDINVRDNLQSSDGQDRSSTLQAYEKFRHPHTAEGNGAAVSLEVRPGEVEQGHVDVTRQVVIESLMSELLRRIGHAGIEASGADLQVEIQKVASAVAFAVQSAGRSLSHADMGRVPQINGRLGTVPGQAVVTALGSALASTSILSKLVPGGVLVEVVLSAVRTRFLVETERGVQTLPMGAVGNNESLASESARDIQNVNGNATGDTEQSSESHDGLANMKTSSMVGALAAAMGAIGQDMGTSMDELASSPVVESVEEEVESSTQTQNIVSSVAEKAFSVASPVVPKTEDGDVDQDRIVAMLADLGQRGGVLRLLGKAALLWGGLRGAMSLTDRMLAFLRMWERPLHQRLAGFVGMALLLWAPVLVPLLPSLLEQWSSQSSGGVASFASVVGLYGAIIILLTIWGRRIRGYDQPLAHYGLRITSPSKLAPVVQGLGLGVLLVASLYSLESYLGYVQFSWSAFAVTAPAIINIGLITASLPPAVLTYWKLAMLVAQALGVGCAVALVEELLFRGWLQEEITVDLGYINAVLLCAAAFAIVHWSLPAVPGLFFLSIALAGVRARDKGDLSVAIGLHSGLVSANYVLTVGGLIQYIVGAPEWLTGAHVANPLAGALGVGVVAVLALFLYPRNGPKS